MYIVLVVRFPITPRRPPFSRPLLLSHPTDSIHLSKLTAEYERKGCSLCHVITLWCRGQTRVPAPSPASRLPTEPAIIMDGFSTHVEVVRIGMVVGSTSPSSSLLLPYCGVYCSSAIRALVLAYINAHELASTATTATTATALATATTAATAATTLPPRQPRSPCSCAAVPDTFFRRRHSGMLPGCCPDASSCWPF